MSDPPRLVDQTDDEVLRSVLRAGRVERPSRAAFRRAAVAIGAGGAAGLAPAAAAGGVVRLLTLGKWLALLTAGASLTAVVERQAFAPRDPLPVEARARPSTSPRASELAAAPGADSPATGRPGAPGPAALAAGPPAAPAAGALDAAPAMAPPVAPGLPLPPPSVRAGVAARALEEVPPSPAAPDAPSPASTAALPVLPLPSAARAPVAGGAPPAESAAPSPSAPSLPSRLALEVAALDEARALLGSGAGARALERLDRYQQDFPGGMLQQEALLVRLEALLQSGQRPAAVALGQRFLASNPGSPLGRRVRSLLGLEVPPRRDAD